jgi:hypothetical protein
LFCVCLPILFLSMLSWIYPYKLYLTHLKDTVASAAFQNTPKDGSLPPTLKLFLFYFRYDFLLHPLYHSTPIFCNLNSP